MRRAAARGGRLERCAAAVLARPFSGAVTAPLNAHVAGAHTARRRHGVRPTAETRRPTGARRAGAVRDAQRRRHCHARAAFSSGPFRRSGRLALSAERVDGQLVVHRRQVARPQRFKIARSSQQQQALERMAALCSVFRFESATEQLSADDAWPSTTVSDVCYADVSVTLPGLLFS